MVALREYWKIVKQYFIILYITNKHVLRIIPKIKENSLMIKINANLTST